VTATTTAGDAAAYSASGFTGTLGKPFTLNALRAVVAAHLGPVATPSRQSIPEHGVLVARSPAAAAPAAAAAASAAPEVAAAVALPPLRRNSGVH
jgi:hypothetical protein